MAAPTAPLVRPAEPGDVPAILDIYNDAVVSTLAIWNEATTDLSERRAWYERRLEGGFPVLVADVAGEVAGYASYGPFRAFEGFRLSAELSVYVAAGRRGLGIGDALMTALVGEARRRGIHVLIGGIEAGNEASLRLHARHGFVETARMPQVGFKFGRWLDLVFMQFILDDGPPPA